MASSQQMLPVYYKNNCIILIIIYEDSLDSELEDVKS